MKTIINFIANHFTNILATIYIIVVQVIAGVFHVAKIWTNKKWPITCLIAIDKVAQFLKGIGKK